ncbi:MAG: hypothetical protein KGJ78_04100 [Alphaproteobacteria bacterium]|nr:hypothetical protein [Alphaproteobacteria bacterium]
MNETELACRKGSNARFVRLIRQDDGTIRMETQDLGGAAIAGEDEYEFWVTVAPDELATLAFELLRERFAGRLDAVDAFRDWCKAHAIAHKFDNWI